MQPNDTPYFITRDERLMVRLARDGDLVSMTLDQCLALAREADSRATAAFQAGDRQAVAHWRRVRDRAERAADARA